MAKFYKMANSVFSWPVWQSSSKEDHYTFRTIPQEHWSIGMSMACPS